MEYEEEDVSSYWMTLTKQMDTGNWNRKRYIALCGELALEEAVNMSYDRLRNEWRGDERMNEWMNE